MESENETAGLTLGPRQQHLVALCHPRPNKPRYVLVCGPRFSTKTVACLHAICDHLWTVKNAHFAVVSPTVSAGEDGGCWWLLTEKIIPQWIAGDFGMHWVQEPKAKGATKKLFCQVSNQHGGVSTLQLDSLQHEDEVEDRYKNKNYSGIYVSELSYFKKRKTYDTLILALRGPDWTDNDFIFLGDTNPAEEGQDSWIYKHWYQFRVDGDVDERAKTTQKLMALVEFTIADNVFMSQERLNDLLATFIHSEDLTARYRDGKWVAAVGDSLFFTVFRPNIHIVGEYETPNNIDPEILLPEEGCKELVGGWDIGNGANSGFVILEPTPFLVPVANGLKEVRIFKAIDEVVYIGSDLGKEDFIIEALEKIGEWNKFLRRAVRWRHWSDRSAFEIKNLGNIYDHQLVYQMSQGEVIMQAANRAPGSVRIRVDLTRELLRQNRLIISRSRCPNLIDSMQGLRAGRGSIAVDKASPFKHAFDAGSYAWTEECFDELWLPKKDLRTGKAGRPGNPIQTITI